MRLPLFSRLYQAFRGSPSYTRHLWFFALFFPFLMGAASTCGGVKSGKKLNYSQGAKQLYERGLAQAKGGNYQAARQNYRRLKTKFPFSRYATLSELAVADTYFEAGKYLRAIDAYKMFEKLHPTHPRVGDASYKAALSYYKLRPFEWFLVPSAFEKDPAPTRKAIKAFRSYLKTHPKHKKVKVAKQQLKSCIAQLAKHELLVAQFYVKRKKHQAVVWRMDHLLKTYPGIGFDAEAYYRKGMAHVALKQTILAHAAFQIVVKRHDKSPYYAKARKQLQRIAGSKPTPRRKSPLQKAVNQAKSAASKAKGTVKR